MRAPSSSIQHSSTPGLDPGKSAVETSRSAGITVKSSRSEDNSFPTARFYLSEHRLCSLHLGSLGSPFFIWERLCVVIPSEADGLRSEPSAKSKDPLPVGAMTSSARRSHPCFLLAAHAAAFRFFRNSFFSTRIPLSTCFSSNKYGGKNLTTVSCVLLNNTPSAKAASTIGRAGISRLIP